MPTSEWLTWDEAAALVGCPVPTIDWYKRQGRIVSRGRHHRSLERRSVEQFAVWWHESQAVKRERSVRKTTRQADTRARAAAARRPPEPTGWITTPQAGALVGVGADEIVHLIKTGTLTGTKKSGRWWLREEDVEAYVADEARWISYVTAADVIGVATSTVAALAAGGHLVRRSAPTRKPSIERKSAEEYAVRHRARKQAESDARAARATRTGPPRDGDVWLDVTTTALLLGISRVRVGQLIRSERIPATQMGRRWWIRRSHAEQTAAARNLRDLASRWSDL